MENKKNTSLECQVCIKYIVTWFDRVPRGSTSSLRDVLLDYNLPHSCTFVPSARFAVYFFPPRPVQNILKSRTRHHCEINSAFQIFIFSFSYIPRSTTATFSKISKCNKQQHRLRNISNISNYNCYNINSKQHWNITVVCLQFLIQAQHRDLE